MLLLLLPPVISHLNFFVQVKTIQNAKPSKAGVKLTRFMYNQIEQYSLTKVVTHSATLLRILHAIVAVSLSALEVVTCNVAEVENSRSRIKFYFCNISCNNFKELTHSVT